MQLHNFILMVSIGEAARAISLHKINAGSVCWFSAKLWEVFYSSFPLSSEKKQHQFDLISLNFKWFDLTNWFQSIQLADHFCLAR